jgi:shikimate dehydrogenase
MQNLFYQNTGVLCLIGHPVKHSYSPFIHNIALNLTGLDYIYLPFDIPQDNLKAAIKGFLALGIKGFNVTLPYKEAIMPSLQSISEEASTIGSVNTVVNDLGKLVGYNTDVHGITETLMPYKDAISGLEVSILGAGGAARAALYALIRYFKPSKINIINRSEQRAESLKIYFAEKMKYEDIEAYELFPPDVLPVLNNSKLIINATPIGMSPDADDSPINNSKIFVPNQIAFDIVYNPVNTRFLQMAQSEGAIPLDGIKMLVHQAAKSFELWTGAQMPVDGVYDALRKYLEP